MNNDVPLSWLCCWPHHVINQIHFTPPKYCSSDQVVTLCSAILNETTLTSWIRVQPEVRFRRETDTGSEKSEGQEIKHSPKVRNNIEESVHTFPRSRIIFLRKSLFI